MNWCEKHDHFKRTCPWCEIELLKSELKQFKERLNKEIEISFNLECQLDKTKEERNALIETLKLYAVDYTTCPNCGMIETDDGEEAREILRKIGVN